jgi:hypothetical protein
MLPLFQELGLERLAVHPLPIRGRVREGVILECRIQSQDDPPPNRQSSALPPNGGGYMDAHPNS